MKNQVSGHSGLRPEAELRLMQEKAEQNRRKEENLFYDLLAVMKKHGIMPNRRRAMIIAFAKWMEGKSDE